MLVLVFNRSEIPQYSNSGISKAHIIPQLLAMFRTEAFSCLAFDDYITTNKKVYKVLMLNTPSVELYRKIIFPFIVKIVFLHTYFKSVLIYVFV